MCPVLLSDIVHTDSFTTQNNNNNNKNDNNHHNHPNNNNSNNISNYCKTHPWVICVCALGTVFRGLRNMAG